MIFDRLAIDGAFLIRPEPVHDDRGWFTRVYCANEFRNHGLVTEFSQHSTSFNKLRGTLRGLHFQATPHEESKLVRCTRGSIYDVIVDLRTNSATLGQWLAFELSPENGLALYIPQGCAHGFVTLEDQSEVHYLISPDHVPGHGRTIRWNDPELNIAWPLQPVVMSDNDRNAPPFHTDIL